MMGSKNSQSDGWSSEDEDDETFEAQGQETMSSFSGTVVMGGWPVQILSLTGKCVAVVPLSKALTPNCSRALHHGLLFL